MLELVILALLLFIFLYWITVVCPEILFVRWWHRCRNRCLQSSAWIAIPAMNPWAWAQSARLISETMTLIAYHSHLCPDVPWCWIFLYGPSSMPPRTSTACERVLQWFGSNHRPLKIRVITESLMSPVRLASPIGRGRIHSKFCSAHSFICRSRQANDAKFSRA